MEAELESSPLLSGIADTADLPILPRMRGALAKIESSPSFEGDGDLAAALLVLHEVIRELSELNERSDQRCPIASEAGYRQSYCREASRGRGQ